MFPSTTALVVKDLRVTDPETESPWQDPEIQLFASAEGDLHATLTPLAYRVSQKPNDLARHLRRIVFCYQHNLQDALYSALLDLLIVLEGKGQALSRRLIYGCRASLDPRCFQSLKTHSGNPARLPGNRYSLFTSGLCGTLQLLKQHKQPAAERDFLALANDCVEYSQLDEAMTILEQGLIDNPQREDAQSILLDLYKSTANQDRFSQTQRLFKMKQLPLSQDWQRLEQFFNGTEK